MTGTYHTWIVILSILVAIAASHAALSLAHRMSRSEGLAAQWWLTGGAVSMGCGIWSMHFIAMMAFELPIPLRYDVPTTMFSLLLAIAAAAYALSIAAQARITLPRLVRSAVMMGIGITAMHYVGMHAITVQPGLTYDPPLFAASVAIAIASSFVALVLFFRLRALRGMKRHLSRAGAAVVMGVAIAGLHYTGMAATRFAPGARCGSGLELDQKWLAVLIAIIAMGLLGVTALLLLVDSHLAHRARRHSRELQQVNRQLQHAATHDPLTGLPNRSLLLDRLDQAAHQYRPPAPGFAVALLDLDRFKTVNDTLGHAVGDELLRQVTARISAVLRPTDTLARLGGDEFVLLLPGTDARTDVQQLLAPVQQAIGAPLQLGGTQLHVAGSIGVAFFPADAASPPALLKHADAAMYHAKRQGRNNLQFYTPELGAVDRERLELENDLRRALDEHQLVLHYQPKVDVRSGRIRGAEALVRWMHPTRGVLPPMLFIPIAEETGMILPIGEWVLREACRELRRWHDRGLTHLTMAVNLSAEQFRQHDLVTRIDETLRWAGIPAHSLELELTESAVMQDTNRSIEMLDGIVKLGVRVSVDDFGTGYSSLSYLRRLPLHTLKIDRSFIRDIESSRDDAEIVRAIVSLAHSLELEVIAEGIETGAQFDFVRALGCEQYQGFHCSAPLPAADFLRAVEGPVSYTARLRRLLPEFAQVPP
jgi:diguanylate cyclase (GGDEF)-like protein